jgi:hypothetical protein
MAIKNVVNVTVADAASGGLNVINVTITNDDTKILVTVVNDVASFPLATTDYAGLMSAEDKTKLVVGLSEVDNTSDIDKPVSSATQSAIAEASFINALIIG